LKLCRNPYFSDKRLQHFDCGGCPHCLKKRKAQWSLRLMHEFLMTGRKGLFITLTFDQKNYTGTVCKKDLQDYFKRLRRRLEWRYGTKIKIKYFACGEYGSKTHRAHYHAIIFGLTAKEYARNFVVRTLPSVSKDDPPRHICLVWQKGHVTIGSVTYESTGYVAGYTQKKLADKRLYQGVTPPFQLQSQSLGKEYALKNQDSIRKNLFIKVKQYKMGVPRYYRKILDITEHDYAEVIEQLNTDMIREAELDGVTVFDDFSEKLSRAEAADYNFKCKRMGLVIGSVVIDGDNEKALAFKFPGVKGTGFPYPVTREFSDWLTARRRQHNLNLEAKLASARSKL